MEEELNRLETIIDTVIELAVRYSFQIFAAIIILIVGAMLARGTSRLVMNICQRKQIDITLTKFFAGVVKILIIAFAVVMALAKFGITIAPMVAAIGAGAFGLTLAIQGPISNYGAGLALILTRPFKVGNTLTIHGLTGIVREIRLGATILETEDGEQIMIPNRKVSGEIFVNSFPYKVVEGSVGIAYSSDPQRAIAVIRECVVAAGGKDAASEPAPQVGIEAFADSSINIGYRYWVRTEAYFQTLYRVNLAIHKGFHEAGIVIPFPQREVRVLNPQT